MNSKTRPLVSQQAGNQPGEIEKFTEICKYQLKNSTAKDT